MFFTYVHHIMYNMMYWCTLQVYWINYECYVWCYVCIMLILISSSSGWLGIPVHRPDDFFCEHMKSDSHMAKVRVLIETVICCNEIKEAVISYNVAYGSLPSYLLSPSSLIIISIYIYIIITTTTIIIIRITIIITTIVILYVLIRLRIGC